jgi:hypothetical protein
VVTATKQRTLSPSWNEAFTMRFRQPPRSVELKVWDADRLTKDDLLGLVNVPLASLWNSVATTAAAPGAFAKSVTGLTGGLAKSMSFASSFSEASLASRDPEGGALRKLVLRARGRKAAGELVVRVAALFRSDATNPLQMRLSASVSSLGISLVDAPDDGRPSEVLYLLLQRAQANVEVRAASSLAVASVGHVQIDNCASRSALSVVLAPRRARAEPACEMVRMQLQLHNELVRRPDR